MHTLHIYENTFIHVRSLQQNALFQIPLHFPQQFTKSQVKLVSVSCFCTDFYDVCILAHRLESSELSDQCYRDYWENRQAWKIRIPISSLVFRPLD